MGIRTETQTASVRMTMEALWLTDRCAIMRKTQVPDPTTGGWSETEAVYASDIPCRVDKSGLSPREYALAERFSAVTLYAIKLSAVAARWPGGLVNVRASDRLFITGDGAGTYEPVDSGGPVSNEVIRELRANRIEEG